MKRIITFTAVILSALSLSSCLRDAEPQQSRFSSEEVTEMTESVTEDATETATEPVPEIPPAKPHAEVMKWTSRHPSPDTVIMTAEEIMAENDRMAGSSASIVDIFTYGDKIEAEMLRELIGRHNVPSEERYDYDGTVISEEHKNEIRERMRVGAEGELSITRGIVASRGELRAIPDNKPYRKALDNPYDSIQHTELAVGTPVLVLYTTIDLEYYFVVSHFYFGWIRTDSVALSNGGELWMSFAVPESFICITDPLYRDGKIALDMGCVLPLAETEKNGYRVLIPMRGADGILSSRESIIPISSASVGYLPYTYGNYLSQAFKYEGTEYGWGGLNDGVDCSGFVLNVFKCFGFSFPRDTKDQDKVVGSALNVAGKGHGEIAGRLDGSVPTAVYYPGHTLLYIGYDENDGKYYFIHAPQIGEKVSVTSKTDLSGMTYIGQVGSHPAV